ncbi:TetR/AcrR family transcriptional regulator, partial [Klebsiella pneumoniae]|uniref:TetR/AcrR family transcriptional regulator n=1 Tax=Klebsiella pneumoniae TaxID=573 RepID=UPI001F4D9A4B
MPRPKLKSDDEVLEAATVVLKRCGPIEFTLSGVAKEVGLSRAALIQRFTNRDTLLVRMMERGVEQVRHYLNAIPIGAGPQGLWEFWHCCKVSDEAAFCLIQRPYISKTL